MPTADPHAGHPVAGVTIPLVTALDAHGRPDAAAVQPLLAHLAAAGITTLMLAGTNGEGPALSANAVRAYAEDVSARWRELAGAPARITVTVAGAGTRETLDRVAALADVDLDAVVALAPFYFRHTQPELYAHFRAVVACGRPVVVYNSPLYTGNALTVDTVGRLLDEPGVIGLKDSSADDELLAKLCDLARDRDDVHVAQGVEWRMASALHAGATGVVPGVAMLAPALCLDLFRLGLRGEHAAAAERQRDVDRLRALFGVRPGASGVVAMKTALHLLGLCPPHAVPPFLPYSDDELAALRAVLAETLGEAHDLVPHQ
ncbi:dihydrodipicolinate synthase family protein [Phytohabitans rumicis]|uniref:4-hydroxy-tetrahydrodipicolinate synthase n=1 Tax=Phytohabitans rumicis TaxID=1076125 RepID=A0A6V8LMB1_9ACTN|nr:dihydrodipicolinate synthase family protein [Phytohabitans rumicis]GFJ95998.1 4-hydroxy-tetrahydrodipicolinate synthase [Phytohabitans rumicis]